MFHGSMSETSVQLSDMQQVSERPSDGLQVLTRTRVLLGPFTSRRTSSKFLSEDDLDAQRKCQYYAINQNHTVESDWLFEDEPVIRTLDQTIPRVSFVLHGLNAAQAVQSFCVVSVLLIRWFIML